MLPKHMTHPRQGGRRKDKMATGLLFIAGVFFLVISVALAGGTAAKELGILEGDPSWRTAGIAFFFVLCASECFTTNITRWAGDVLRAIAGRFAGKAGE